jgi:hypothetical protein
MKQAPGHSYDWQGFTTALAGLEVPPDFLSPEGQQQGVYVRDPLEAACTGSPTSDGQAGMAWWNSLSEADRRYWCLAGMTAVPAEAWKYFQLVTAPRKLVKRVTNDD